MGLHPAPAPGRRPLEPVYTDTLPLPLGCVCTWMLRLGRWELKYLAALCLMHRDVAAGLEVPIG